MVRCSGRVTRVSIEYTIDHVIKMTNIMTSGPPTSGPPSSASAILVCLFGLSTNLDAVSNSYSQSIRDAVKQLLIFVYDIRQQLEPNRNSVSHRKVNVARIYKDCQLESRIMENQH